MDQSAIKTANGNPKPAFMEHRWGQRMPCRARARLSAGAVMGAGHLRNVSSSGAFIETGLDLPVHTQVELVVLGNESATRTVEVNASVVRVERDGIGVEWSETPGGSICAVIGCTTRCAHEGAA